MHETISVRLPFNLTIPGHDNVTNTMSLMDNVEYPACHEMVKHNSYPKPRTPTFRTRSEGVDWLRMPSNISLLVRVSIPWKAL